MSYNGMKLGVVAVLAMTCIVALILDTDTNKEWAVPILGILIGYVVGNAEFTQRSGATSPVVSLPPPPAE